MNTALDELWASAPRAVRTFPPDGLSALPEAARRYLTHAIRPGARLANAARLRMHGELKLGKWRSFTAEEVLHPRRGLVWAAAVRLGLLSIRGSDRLVDGVGAVDWRWLGLFPVMTAAGPDIVRSAAGRLLAELCWLPSALAAEHVSWRELDFSHVQARVTAAGHTGGVTLTVAPGGGLGAVQLRRWGNPGGGPFQEMDFGAAVEQEATFGDYTIPSRLRVGWHFGTPRFESEGEFFRGWVDAAEFR